MLIAAAAATAMRLPSSSATCTFTCCCAIVSSASSGSAFLTRPSTSRPNSSAMADPSTHSVTSQASRASALAGARAASSASAASGTAGVDVAANLAEVRTKIAGKVSECNRPEGSVRLVAVSKTKPVELLMDAYNAGQRSFGENYAQELVSKAAELPPDISWHFIGPLQSNKAAPLVKNVGLPKLACVETVATMKLANKLNNAVENLENYEGSEDDKKLGIYLQVNTSGEESKSGLAPGEELISLAKDITANCPRLSIDGLMTIGAPGDLGCFDTLVKCREDVAEALGLDSVDTLDLSMGMSGDYPDAIERGATSVRVGSTIFGARDYSNLNKK